VIRGLGSRRRTAILTSAHRRATDASRVVTVAGRAVT
jgi:hypothetical protein